MTIRDIAIAIGFDVDDAALKKVFERLNDLKDKTVKVQAQNPADDTSARQAAEEQVSTVLQEQSQTTQEILQNEREINDSVKEQAEKQKEISQSEQKINQQTQQTVRSKISLRDVLQRIFHLNKQNTTETDKETKKKNVLLSVAGKVLEKVRAIGKAIKGQGEETEHVTSAYQEMLGKIKSLVATLGIGFSLVQLKQISEEFGSINNQIRSATEGMGEQSEIQQKILQAANNSRTAYGDTAKFVGNLVQSNKELFGSVDEAAQYAELTNKLFRSAGKTSEQVAEMQEALNQSFARGVVDTETISRLLEESPEAVKLLEKEVGASKEKFEEMASSGELTVADLKNAFVNGADEINRSFAQVDMTISDALLNIRNQWGLWIAKIDKQYGLTKKLSEFLVSLFSKLMKWLDKAVAFVDKLADKVGGMENLLKLIAMAAGSIWIALNASKILTFFKSLSGLLTLANLKTLALVAVILLIALAIDDLIHFLNGDASVIGEFFEKMGIDADDARETISSVISFLGTLITIIVDLIGKGLKGLGDFFIWSTEKVQQAGEKVGKTIRSIMDWFGSLKEKALDLIDTIANSPLGKLIGGAINIGGIECDALIHHELQLENQIPDYPVEEGFSVQDTIIQNPKTLTLTVVVTNTPITFREHASPNRVQEIAERFQELYKSRQLITVTSSKGVFQNMGITSLSLPYDVSTKTSLEIPITLKEVLTTTAKTVAIPSEYGRGGDTGTTAGTASTSPYGNSGTTGSNVVGNATNSVNSSEKDGSIAYNALTGLFGKDGLESGVETIVDLLEGNS